MQASFLFADKDTCRLTDVVSSSLSPWNGRRVFLTEDVNEVAINLDAALGLFDGTLEAS